MVSGADIQAERSICWHFTILGKIKEMVDAEIGKEFKLAYTCTLFPFPFGIFSRPDIVVYSVGISSWFISQFVSIHFHITLNRHSTNLLLRYLQSSLRIGTCCVSLQSHQASARTDIVSICEYGLEEHKLGLHTTRLP